MVNEVDKKNRLFAILSVLLILLAQAFMAIGFCLLLPAVDGCISRLWVNRPTFPLSTEIARFLSQKFVVLVHFIPFIISALLALSLLLDRRRASLDFTKVMFLMIAVSVSQGVFGGMCYMLLWLAFIINPG